MYSILGRGDLLVRMLRRWGEMKVNHHKSTRMSATAACRSCESSRDKIEYFICFKMRLDLRLCTMIFSQLPSMRTSISPVPTLVYIPLNMSICMRTFTHACRSCERSRDKIEYFPCFLGADQKERGLWERDCPEYVYMHENIYACVQVV